ncbi:glyceraldehyde-3-phosphate dehydrogenase [Pararhodobacter marinus]|uniref:Glyceraldehyde-3-phosphate dehydrogenase n=1 Tax=Pararhodobacter marinus TaxID=2184063 RepID=A0A2U2CI92_9RHOB|nr:glyceraldehyde 3-phosphate dehydrogenase NAD-binding domain-containing protein [Pararhodobacter marinus]PWE31613.1 glyceraldehyde-3-phosphate dehydrogenase [Pararhodobacter marinus]
MRVMINGFGRIGRTVLRAWLSGRWPGIEIVAVNDIAPPETCAYLLEFDSVFGPLDGVSLQDDRLIVQGHDLSLSQHADISAMDLSSIDLVLECTGKADSRAFAERGLAAGAGKVLISGPSDSADTTLVLGANDGLLLPGMRIVSNASCTTNALAPLARVLNEAFGIKAGWMTTIHCYTGSQPTIDAPRSPDMARNRAAALSMVPTTTSAGRLLDRVLPELAGVIECAAVRVPTASVSAVDLCILPDRRIGVEAVNDVLRHAGGVVGWTEKPLVSSDLRARPESIVMALPETRVTGVGLIRVFGWYDNEWGFSCRMLDMALRMDGGRA